MVPTVEILSTGDELLTGQVVDTNSTWLMDRLWDLGVMVRRKTLVGDDRADLDASVPAVEICSDRSAAGMLMKSRAIAIAAAARRT